MLTTDEKRLQSHRNHICMNVNSDHDKAVVVETLMMGLLVSGLVWLKVKQRRTKEFSKQPSGCVLVFVCAFIPRIFSI